VLLTKYYSGDQIQSNGMGGACSTYEVDEGRIRGFGGVTWGKRDHVEDLGVDGRIILEFVLKISVGRAWSGLIWLRSGACVASCSERGMEVSNVS
jgi:hypothetical protein